MIRRLTRAITDEAITAGKTRGRAGFRLVIETVIGCAIGLAQAIELDRDGFVAMVDGIWVRTDPANVPKVIDGPDLSN